MLNLDKQDLLIMVTAGFIMTKAGVAATLANLTGVALLASPWGVAALTVAGMVAAGRAASKITEFLFKKSFRIHNQKLRMVAHMAAFYVPTGLIAGLGLATVVAPWLAVVGGFSAIMARNAACYAEKYACRNKNIHVMTQRSGYLNGAVLLMKGAVLLTPLAPAGAAGFVVRSLGMAAAMVPGSVAAWATPTTAMLFAGAGAVGATAKQTIDILSPQPTR